MIEAVTKIFNKNNDNPIVANEYIDDLLQRVRKRKLLILEPMEDKEIASINNYIKNINDISAFVIKKNILVLKYEHQKKYIPICKLSDEGDELYKKGDYEGAIKKWREITELDNEFPSIFNQIGHAYLKLNDINLAYDYLLVAQELSYKRGISIDNQAILQSLKEKKENTINSIDINKEYYGVEDISKVYNLIASGMNVFTACKSLNLTKEEELLVILIIAKDSYNNGLFRLGNKYLRYVEKSEGKTIKVKRVLEEIKEIKNSNKNVRKKKLVLEQNK